MRISTKIISLAASAALVAGAGAMAAAPAGAAGSHVHGKDTIKGSSVVTIPMSVGMVLSENGISLEVSPPATLAVDGSTGSTGVTFPVSGPVGDGVIHHKGTLSVISDNGVTLTLADPLVEYSTDGSTTTGVLKSTLNGLPDWMAPFNALNGQVVRSFDLTDLKFTVKTGKVVKKGKGFARADMVTSTGNVLFPDDQDAANLFNTALTGSPTTLPKQLFVPGMPFGTYNSKFTVTHVCKTKAECKA